MPRKVRTPKLRGELAEAIFVACALALGYIVLKPYGDSAPYDFVIAGASGRFKRVQVKAAFKHFGRGYQFICTQRKSRPYTHKDVDFFAACIYPESLWYIIPVRAVFPRLSFYLLPNGLPDGAPSRWERFRDAWWRLGKAIAPATPAHEQSLNLSMT